MSWQPKLNSVPQPQSKGNLLSKATRMAKETFIQELKDEHGIFAVVTDKSIICAKDYIYGSVVSCHARAVLSAYNQKKPLVMWIEKVGKFYSFDPKTILDNYEENFKGSARMWNFDIKLGVRR